MINHRDNKKTTVERFELTQNKLTFKESISSEGFISPNDLTSFGENQFYYSEYFIFEVCLSNIICRNDNSCYVFYRFAVSKIQFGKRT